MTRVRCAIYTRKSSDEGLDQAFNSLDAQREACEAYIRSQKHEGWKPLATRYDDGGASGGNMEREALQHLLADIDAGRVDMVVVYKIDRLTRSLADFAKLVERLEAAGASFVSVTQQFNTSTSMGRLTLNVLLSFAQFEREVTAERIRDKIAASKKKGMWMGGLVPLGYDKTEVGLVINPYEAVTVRRLFEAYLDVGSVRALKTWADRAGLVSKTRIFKSGTMAQGKAFTRGALYHLLSNPIYVGKIAHKSEVYDGQHEAIIADELWQGVQARLSDSAVERKTRRNARNPSLLAGKVFDADGRPLTPSHACKSSRRYRYYVAQDSDIRLPAIELEQAVLDALGQARDLSLAFEREGLQPSKADLFDRVTRVRILDTSLQIHMRFPDSNRDHVISTEFKLRRRGVETRLVLNGDQAREPDQVLIRRILKAMDWLDQIKLGRRISDIAAAENITPEYITHNMDIAFLSPKILKAIAVGKQRADVTAYQLSKISIPANWAEQDAIFLD